MKSIFLSHEQLFDKPLAIFDKVGTAAPASDFALLTTPDDGFLQEPGGGINYYLADGCADRFGRDSVCSVCAVRPVLLLEEGDEKLLTHVREEGGVLTAEYGRFPSALLDMSLRELAEREYRNGTLLQSKKTFAALDNPAPIYLLGGKRIIRHELSHCGASGYVMLRDGTAAAEGDAVFLAFRPVRWLYDKERGLLICCQALFGGMNREQAAAYLASSFLEDLNEESEASFTQDAPFRFSEHDELSLIRAYVEADIPVFLHGLSGDGKSDRVRQIDP